MAQKKQQYEGAADSIFSFIFSGARKSGPQKPPQKLDGVSGSEMAYALSEIASQPAVYASEQVFTPLNESFNNIALSENKMKLDDKTPVGTVKVAVNVNNFSEFVSNPEGFIDGAFGKTDFLRKQANKLNRVRGFGGILDLGIGAIAARRLGAPPIESLEMGEILGSEYMNNEKRNFRAEELAAMSVGYQVGAAGGLNYNDANKLAKTFASVMDSSKVDIELSKQNGAVNDVAMKGIIRKKMAGYGYTNSTQVDDLFVEYVAKTQKYGQKKDGTWSLGTLDQGIEKRRANFGVNVDEWIGSENPADKLRALKYEELESKVNFLAVGSPERAQTLKEMSLIQTWQIANGHKMRLSRYLGEASLNMQAINNLVVQGNALPMILSGDFFDLRKNNLSPSKTANLKINGMNFEDVVVARENMNPLYRRLTGIYYWTPGSIAKTLFVNGEGFVYSAHKKQEKIRRMISGSGSLYNYTSGPMGGAMAGLLGGASLGNQAEVLKILATGDNYLNVLNILQTNRASITNPDLLKLLDKMEALDLKIKKSLGLRYANRLRKIYGGISNFFKGITSKIFGKKLGAFFVEGRVALKALVRKAVKAAIKAFLHAFGAAATGGLFNLVVGAVTEVVYFVAEKLLAPMFKLIVLILWSLLVVFIMLIVSIFSWFDALNPFSNLSYKFDTAGNTAPIYSEECATALSGGPISSPVTNPGGGSEGTVGAPGGGGGGAGGDSGEQPPPDMANSICPLGEGSIRCSQGPYRGVSHAKTNAIDVTGPPPLYWYAPSDGVITRSLWTYENSRVKGQLCGGIVNFQSSQNGVTYVLVHVVPEVKQNEGVKAGQKVARMALEKDGNIHFRNFRDYPGTCTDGAHFHLEVRGTSVYADRYYREFLNCNLATCPGSAPAPAPSPSPSPTACGDFKSFTDNELKALGDSVLGTSNNKPSITGNAQADNIIRTIAENRGYKPRIDAGGFNGSAESAFNKMVSEGKVAGVNIGSSAVYKYRTVERQRELFLGDLKENCTKNNYANIINRSCDSAIDQILRTRSIPGYSKHHTGYAIDLQCDGGSITSFGGTKCEQWLIADNYCNAKKQGFIPSYPRNATKQGPNPEAWEYIWIGVDKLK